MRNLLTILVVLGAAAVFVGCDEGNSPATKPASATPAGGGNAASGSSAERVVSLPDADVQAIDKVGDVRKAIANGDLASADTAFQELSALKSKVTDKDVIKLIDKVKTELDAAKNKGSSPSTQPSK